MSYFDDNEDRIVYGRHLPRNRDAFGPPMECRRCGSSRVYWQMVKGQHQLYNRDTLEPHRCPKAAIEPLEALPEDDE